VSARRGLILPALLALAACETGTVEPATEAGLALQIVLSPSLVSAPDAGTLHVEGPTTRTVSLGPGQTTTVSGLQPGGYTLALEAFAAGRVVGFSQTTTSVVAGQDRQVTITPASFVPAGVNVPAQVPLGDPVTVSFQPVPGANGYVVQWADNPEFTNLQSFQVDGTSADFTLGTEGLYYVRVFARTRFGSDGEPTEGTQVEVVPGSLVLENGVPLTGRSGAAGSFTVYTFQVPAGGAGRVLQFRVRGGTGNPDLYVRRGSEPTTGTFDCRSAIFTDSYSNNLDFCSILDPQPATWYVGVHGADAYSDVTVDANILDVVPLELGAPVTGLAGAISDVRYFVVGVPTTGVATLHLETTGGSGDADLFASPAASPFGLTAAASWPCVSKENASTEVCDIDAPEGGPWIVILTGYSEFSGVTLQADVVPTSQAPAISNPSFSVVSVNSCTNTGSSINVTFDYQDPDGDVDATVPVHTRFTFQPSGTTGENDAGFTRTGDGSSGSVSGNYCIVFGTNTQVDLGISIADLAGNPSNEVNVSVPKPAGANVPSGAPGPEVIAGR